MRRVGITPAYAGKTKRPIRQIRRFQDHPRIRGKDRRKKDCLVEDLGSPPHTRERRSQQQRYCQSYRITPAYAGKTASHTSFRTAHQDHPRIRGKDWNSMSADMAAAGSPPHTRERRSGLCAGRCDTGITPAYAGKTIFEKIMIPSIQDHPRIRGKDR